ncbi:hypothetical protein M0D45_08175 [Xanthomonas prunicola]|uniref:hypothetical protein n=1 Tax=Xanthomonas prunicola TaxID=2053930 RepID=UPI0021B24ACA|nr:hypothetical protein [Xanthomonas prunicola]UXA54675.1 hypothetical protein M0D45_08175 [Xanthomonas prunicola]
MATRDVVFPQGRHALYERHHYSPAVRADGLLFVAGQVGSREDGSPEPELDAEIARAFVPTVTAVGVTWLAGFQFEIKVVVKLPATAA